MAAQGISGHVAVTSGMYSRGMEKRNALREFVLDVMDRWDIAVENLGHGWKRLRKRLRDLFRGQRPK